MICLANCFEADGLPEPSELVDGEVQNSAEYIGLVADMIDVVLSQPDELSLDPVQAETMAIQFLREAIPNIGQDAKAFGILNSIESARTSHELTFAAGQLRMLARAISAQHEDA